MVPLPLVVPPVVGLPPSGDWPEAPLFYLGAAREVLTGLERLRTDADGAELFALHQFLIGLRRRHAWLHRARTTALHLDNRCYVYETRCGDESLVVALSVSDTPVSVRLPAAATVIAGSGAPPEQTLTDLMVPPHGWRVAAPL